MLNTAQLTIACVILVDPEIKMQKLYTHRVRERAQALTALYCNQITYLKVKGMRKPGLYPFYKAEALRGETAQESMAELGTET